MKMMLDLTTCPPTPPSPSPGANATPAGVGGESSKFKTFMGRTPAIGILKSKFLTVLGNSNDLLNGISNKLALSISSSESEYCDDDEEDIPKFDDSIDYTKIDYESRRLKARRAHEEIVSGRYRYPSLIPKPRLGDIKVPPHPSPPSTSSSSSSASSLSNSWHEKANINAERNSCVSSTTRSNSIESRHSGGYGRPGRAIAGARRSDLDIQKDLVKINELLNNGTPQIDVQPPPDREQMTIPHPSRSIHALDTVRGDLTLKMPASTSANSMWMPQRSRTSNSSTLTSLRDDPDMLAAASPSIESTDWRSFIRSESQNSVPSWASSISLDCRTGEEPVKEFMKHFTETLFAAHGAISLELKCEFGAMVRMDMGRQWFTRFLLEHKSKCRRVDENTFHALIQFMAIALFECGECQDYAPAGVIMNLCFIFYREIDVPGCEPYREYLFVFLRQQPIWQTIRFWNAAFCDRVQNEIDHRTASKKRRAEKRRKEKEAEEIAIAEHAVDASSSSSSHHVNPDDSFHTDHPRTKQPKQQQQQQNIVSLSLGKDPNRGASNSENHVSEKDQISETKLRENIGFRLLGTFTSNMHSLGVPQELCLEFLKKQTTSLNLPKNKIKIVRDSINRMYQETDLWGAKDNGI